MNTDNFSIDDDTTYKPEYQVKAMPDDDEKQADDDFDKDLHPQELEDDYDIEKDEALKDITDHSDLAEPEMEQEPEPVAESKPVKATEEKA